MKKRANLRIIADAEYAEEIYKAIKRGVHESEIGKVTLPKSYPTNSSGRIMLYFSIFKEEKE